MQRSSITLSVVLPAVLCSSVLAQTQLQRAERTRLVVDSTGARMVHELGWASPTGPSAKNTSPGLVWELGDNGALWIATAVSIGDRGYQVFNEYALNNESNDLLSCFDSNPPTAVWSDGSLAGDFFGGEQAVSADATNTKVAVDQTILGGNQSTRQAVVRKYTSSSGTPDWTYTFTPVINAGSHVGISRDGKTIVAAIYDNNLNQVDIAVFGPNSGTPVSLTAVQVNLNDYMRGFDLSADGSTLYYSAGVTAHIFDIATTTDTVVANIGASFDSHAISGNGSVFAYGNFNSMSVWEKQAGVYVNTFNESVPGQNYCAIIDISDDGSTIASGWTFYDHYLTVRAEALDVATKTVTMTNTAVGTGTKQNIVADVSISADGKFFAVGCWGDAGGVVPECRIFSRSSNTPVASVNLPGSVFDCDMSADGARAVFGSKAVHANDFGNGGKVDLVATGNEDFALRGAPHIGSTVNFDMYFTPGKNAFLMQALAESVPPHTFAGIGTLFIDRSTLTFSPAGVVPPSGIATKSLSIANNPSLIGTALYFQGFSVPPRQLSNDWVKMTILP